MKRVLSKWKQFLRTPSHLERIPAEQGNVLLLVAFSMVAIFGMGALVVDVGSIYLQQSRMQAAVDAGALAGVQAYIRYGKNGVVATTTAQQVAEQNNSNYTYVVPPFQNNEVQVTASESVPLWFATLWGLKQQRLQVTGKAQVGGLAASIGVVPIGVQLSDLEDGHNDVKFSYNTLSTLAREGEDRTIPFVYLNFWGKTDSGHEGDSSGSDSQTNSQGDSMLGQYIKTGYTGTVKVGDPVHTLDGEAVGLVAPALDYRRTASTEAACQSYQTATADCSQVLLLPVVSSTEDEEDHPPTIVGFVSFYLAPSASSDKSGNGQDNGNGYGNGYGNGQDANDGHVQFQGYFLQIAHPGTVGISQDLGTYTARLIH